jgi:uncharacterized membrane protein
MMSSQIAARTCAVLAALGAVVSAGCGQPSASAPSVDCKTVTVPKYSELKIWPLCTTCHSTSVTGRTRQDAPGDVNFDTYMAAVMQAGPAAVQVNAGSMPPPREPQPTPEQKSALYAWALCGTPN